MDSTKALIIASIPVGLLAIGHIKSLPLVYTLRSWLLLRSILRKAKNNDMRPVRKLTFPWIFFFLIYYKMQHYSMLYNKNITAV